MKRFFFCLAVLLCSIVQLALAQGSYRVQGMVADSISGEHLDLVSVQLKAPGSSVGQYVQLSDTTGRFQFENVKAGKYDAILSFIGYQTKTLPLTVNKN